MCKGIMAEVFDVQPLQVSDISPENVSNILSRISPVVLSDISLTICLTFFLANVLASLLTFFLPVEVRHGNTGSRGSRLRSGREHWQQRIAVEVRQGTLAQGTRPANGSKKGQGRRGPDGRRGRRQGEGEGNKADIIKISLSLIWQVGKSEKSRVSSFGSEKNLQKGKPSNGIVTSFMVKNQVSENISALDRLQTWRFFWWMWRAMPWSVRFQKKNPGTHLGGNPKPNRKLRKKHIFWEEMLKYVMDNTCNIPIYSKHPFGGQYIFWGQKRGSLVVRTSNTKSRESVHQHSSCHRNSISDGISKPCVGTIFWWKAQFLVCLNKCQYDFPWYENTPQKFNIAPEKEPSQKDSTLSTTIFQWLS